MYLVNVKIHSGQKCPQIKTKTDSNHEKSEVKVVFIRNGFHTTLLHKTRKKQSVHLETIYKQKKGNNIQNN